MDGFRIVTRDGRLAISEPWTALLIEWAVLALWVLAMGMLLTAARGAADAPLLLVALSVLTALPLYLLGIGRHPRFVFDNTTRRLLRGRRALCEHHAIAALAVEESPEERAGYRVIVLCRDGRRYVIGESASHQAALHLAKRIHDHTGIPIRTEPA